MLRSQMGSANALTRTQFAPKRQSEEHDQSLSSLFMGGAVGDHGGLMCG